jgi:DNA-binding response OmpR family regulator
MSNDAKTVVLIADDEPSTLALLGRHLRSRGFSVLEAADGDEAWELAHEHLPDLVILDVMMPGMSGWEVCRKVREAVSLAHTGVIMLTGIGETLNEMTSPLYGADAHVDKPFEFAALDARISEVLERRRAGTLGRPDSGAEEVRVALADVAKPIAKTKPTAAKTKTPAKAKAKAKPAEPKPAKAAKKPAAAPKKAAPKKAAPKKAAPKKAAKKPAPPPAKKAKKAKKAKAKPKVAKKPSKAKPRPPKAAKKAASKKKPAKKRR